MASERFDPTKHLRMLPGQGQSRAYLDVKWRLVWLRQEHPEAQVTTEHIQITAEQAVFRANVSVPGQGSATAYGSAARSEISDYIERAEERAVGRALLVLGYGTEFASDYEMTEGAGTTVTEQAPSLPPGVTVGPGRSQVLPPRIAAALAAATPIIDHESESETSVPSPPARDDAAGQAAVPAPGVAPAAPAAMSTPQAGEERQDRSPRPPRSVADGQAVRYGRAARPATRPPSPSPNEATGAPASENPAATRPAAPEDEHAPAEQARGRGGERPEASRRPGPPAEETMPADDTAADDELADNDWTAFWRWARRQGYNNRDEIEQAIKQPIKGRTPREVRTLILNLED